MKHLLSVFRQFAASEDDLAAADLGSVQTAQNYSLALLQTASSANHQTAAGHVTQVEQLQDLIQLVDIFLLQQLLQLTAFSSSFYVCVATQTLEVFPTYLKSEKHLDNFGA